MSGQNLNDSSILKRIKVWGNKFTQKMEDKELVSSNYRRKVIRKDMGLIESQGLDDGANRISRESNQFLEQLQ